MTRTTSSDRTEVVLSSRKHDQHSQIQIRGDLNLPFPDTLDIGISDEPKKKGKQISRVQNKGNDAKKAHRPNWFSLMYP